MKVLLLNDNAIVPHVGCLAVSDAHARMLAFAGHEVVDRCFVWELSAFADRDEEKAIGRVMEDPRLRARIEGVDAVVCNGEGTIHHGAGLDLLATLGAAQRLGRRTFLVNSVIQDVPGYHDVLRRVDDLTVRDQRSGDELGRMGVACRVVPDSAIEAVFSDEPLIRLDDKVAVLDWHPARNADVGNALIGYMDAHADTSFYFPLFHGVQRWLWRHSVATLRTARAVVTARHHGVYLAAMAGRPFVALPSNTHKIEGIIEASGLPIPICTDLQGLERAVAWALENSGVYAEFSAWLVRQRPLTTFRGLGIGGPPLDPVVANARVDEAVVKYGFTLAPQARLWPFGLIPELAKARDAQAK